MAQKPEKIQAIRYAPPPPGIPIHGFVPSDKVSFLGRANYTAALQAKNFIFGVARADRARHMYVIGKSGSGKSKFLELLLRQDIAYGYGLCFIDPHGDIAEEILDFIPESRKNDVRYVDLRDREFPVSVNPFFGMPEHYRHQYVEFLMEIFREYCGALWTAEAEYVSRFIFLALLDYKRASFFGVLSMLTSPDYRKEVLEEVKDPVVRDFWKKEFPKKAKIFEEKVTLPWKTRFGHLFFDSHARHLFSQERSSVNFEEALKEKYIILITLPKGAMPDDVVAFIGALYLALFRIATLMRRGAKGEFPDFYLYVDEFQNLQLSPFIHLLPECGKSGISVTLAHRYIGQLPDGVRTAIFGNVGTQVIFRVSGEDAVRLRSEMAPVFDAKDMLNLGTREFYIKTIVRGEAADPFSGEALRVFPSTASPSRGEMISRSRDLLAVLKDEAERNFERELSAYSWDSSEKPPEKVK